MAANGETALKTARGVSHLTARIQRSLDRIRKAQTPILENTLSSCKLQSLGKYSQSLHVNSWALDVARDRACAGRPPRPRSIDPRTYDTVCAKTHTRARSPTTRLVARRFQFLDRSVGEKKERVSRISKSSRATKYRATLNGPSLSAFPQIRLDARCRVTNPPIAVASESATCVPPNSLVSIFAFREESRLAYYGTVSSIRQRGQIEREFSNVLKRQVYSEALQNTLRKPSKPRKTQSRKTTSRRIIKSLRERG